MFWLGYVNDFQTYLYTRRGFQGRLAVQLHLWIGERGLYGLRTRTDPLVAANSAGKTQATVPFAIKVLHVL